jgi:hypothetical protein
VNRQLQMPSVQMRRVEYGHRLLGESCRELTQHWARVRVIIFRVLATLAGFFFVVAVVLMASAPWVLWQPDQVARTELNRWFLTVAGSVDAIAAGVLFALALRPRRTLLIVEHATAAVVAGVIILPFQPSFAAFSRWGWCR